MRSATFAFIVVTTVITTRAVADNWLVQQEISPLDDSTNVFLWTEALETIPDRFGQPMTPTLLIRCQENTTSVAINWEMYLGIGESQIIYRIDRLPAETQEWRLSTNREAIGLWNGSSAIPFINRLFDREMLLARITPYGESPVTAVFRIGGLKAAAAPLMEACHWQPRAAAGMQAGPTPTAPSKEDDLAWLRQDRLTLSELDALRRQIARCWTLPVGIEGLQNMVVQLRIQVGPDRSVQQVTIQDRARLERDASFRAVAESAKRAVDRCSPLDLPVDKYALWRDIMMSFHPEDAVSG